jgi:hypothetical protein
LRPSTPFDCWFSLVTAGGFIGVLTEVVKS